MNGPTSITTDVSDSDISLVTVSWLVWMRMRHRSYWRAYAHVSHAWLMSHMPDSCLICTCHVSHAWLVSHMHMSHIHYSLSHSFTASCLIYTSLRRQSIKQMSLVLSVLVVIGLFCHIKNISLCLIPSRRHVSPFYFYVRYHVFKRATKLMHKCNITHFLHSCDMSHS